MTDPLDPMNQDRTPYFSGEGIAGAGGAGVWNDEWDVFWRDAFSTRPYVPADATYEQYRGAYRYGHESAARLRDRSWDESEPELQRGWDAYANRGEHAGDWSSARDAVRDAWEHVRRNLKL